MPATCVINLPAANRQTIVDLCTHVASISIDWLFYRRAIGLVCHYQLWSFNELTIVLKLHIGIEFKPPTLAEIILAGKVEGFELEGPKNKTLIAATEPPTNTAVKVALAQFLLFGGK